MLDSIPVIGHCLYTDAGVLFLVLLASACFVMKSPLLLVYYILLRASQARSEAMTAIGWKVVAGCICLLLAGSCPAQANRGSQASGAQTAVTPSQNQAAPEKLPNAPSSGETEPSLKDLGFPPEAIQGNVKEQALLDKRAHMLKIHQRIGLITTVPMLAAIFSSAGAGGRGKDTTGRDLHLALGAVAGDLYFVTAYYAIRAPKPAATETRGPIRFHRAMAWVHGPGMILTPILGALAYDQKSKGEKVHGIAAAHMPVAIVTAGAFGAALLSVSIRF